VLDRATLRWIGGPVTCRRPARARLITDPRDFPVALAGDQRPAGYIAIVQLD
jgi:hypothetical protein